ncbi:MAG: CoA ester lyase [Desulfobacteraceae bacterium]|jgi:citrate lyase subunit beta/citryl-CoA lyase
MQRLRRSRIYLPGNSPRMIQKGPHLGADAVILDLEDSVSPEEKDAARILVARAIETLDFGGSEVMVRINPIHAGGLDDLPVVLAAGPDSIVVPKCECRDDVLKIDSAINDFNPAKPVAILPMIETAKGILNAYEVASASPRVDAVTFGGEDFTQDIGATRTKQGREIFWGRSMLVIAAKAAGVQALDTVFSDLKDEQGLRRDTRTIKEMGFDGRAAVHPAQIEIIHDVFTPTETEIQHAADVISAAEKARREGLGVAVVKGKMVDKPIIQRAEKIIRIAERLELPIPGSSHPRQRPSGSQR